MVESMKLEGMEELRKQFSRLKDTAQPGVIRSGLRAATRPVIKEARARVPVKSGKLKKSIRASVDRTKDRKGFVAKIGFSQEAWYGQWVELGSSRQPARPFLRPALEAAHDDVVRSFFGGILKRIAKITAKSGR